MRLGGHANGERYGQLDPLYCRTGRVNPFGYRALTPNLFKDIDGTAHDTLTVENYPEINGETSKTAQLTSNARPGRSELD
jgi:hypothetical protein